MGIPSVVSKRLAAIAAKIADTKARVRAVEEHDRLINCLLRRDRALTLEAMEAHRASTARGLNLEVMPQQPRVAPEHLQAGTAMGVTGAASAGRSVAPRGAKSVLSTCGHWPARFASSGACRVAALRMAASWKDDSPRLCLQRVGRCRPRTSAIRSLNLKVSFPAVRSRARPALADPQPTFSLLNSQVESSPSANFARCFGAPTVSAVSLISRTGFIASARCASRACAMHHASARWGLRSSIPALHTRALLPQSLETRSSSLLNSVTTAGS